ncbi:hypothetical protein [Legionella sp. km772]|uniref:hypothetical protein n=1 Tax=Legionella sp. km772 TaxID=2498111 RepID=UPI000F8D91E5|nr:hypothetical protein [Legionella sp. km772]RUR09064.1 hypothetical protein ELY15_09700 [Legionella sp. km772]
MQAEFTDNVDALLEQISLFDDRVAQENALVTLCRLSENCPKNQKELSEKGGIENLIKLLAHPSSEVVQGKALDLLWILSANYRESGTIVREKSMIEVLIQVSAYASLSADKDSAIALRALLSLSVAGTEGERKKIVDSLLEYFCLPESAARLKELSLEIVARASKEEISSDPSGAIIKALDSLFAIRLCRLIALEKWDDLAIFVKHANKEVLLRFKEFTGVDLKTYLQVNINAACAASSIAMLSVHLPASEALSEEGSFSPKNLPADPHNRTQQKKALAQFWGIKEEELWRL